MVSVDSPRFNGCTFKSFPVFKYHKHCFKNIEKSLCILMQLYLMSKLLWMEVCPFFWGGGTFLWLYPQHMEVPDQD